MIYIGLMITKDGPKVLEFNARFGDPECQPIMMRLKSDLVPLLEATIDGKLNQIQPQWYEDPAVCVVLSARGYPGPYDKGDEIRGLDKLRSLGQGLCLSCGHCEGERSLAYLRRPRARGHREGRRHWQRREKCLFRREPDYLGRDALSQGHCSQGDS